MISLLPSLIHRTFNLFPYKINRITWLLLLALFIAGCDSSNLYTNLKESEANQMIAVLSQHGITASKSEGKEETFTLSVENNRFAEAVEVLRQQSLPRDQFTDVGAVFARAGLISSPAEERIRFVYATSQEIAETLSNIDGIVTVRVHIVVPDNDPFVDKIRPSSASVFIKHWPTADIDLLVPKVKMFVVNSVEGLSYDKVSVVLVPAQNLAFLDTTIPNTSSPSSSPLLPSLVALLLIGIGSYSYYRYLRKKQPPSKTKSKESPVT